jgi:hypothetical protein
VVATVLFVIVGLAICLMCVLAVLVITHVEMGGSEAIKRDGMRAGARAPRWELADYAGVIRTSPPRLSLQLIVFAGHSLKSFPSVVEGVRTLAAEAADLEIVLLFRHEGDIVRPMLEVIGLGSIPAVAGPPSLWGRYNVRVSPWLMFVDSAGLVRASSLVNEDWQVTRLYQIARLPLGAVADRTSGRFGRRASRAGV